MKPGVNPEILLGVMTVAPRILKIARDLPVHLHDRREAAKLSPAHKEIRRRDAEIRILVSSRIMTPDGVPGHCRGLPGDNHAGQTIVTEIGFVISGPMCRKRRR